jgi:hypothetical protein
MSLLSIILWSAFGLLAVLAGGAIAAIRARNMQYWIGSYAFPEEPRPRWHIDDELDVFIAVCDHWEPECYGASHERARERVRRWVEEYPALLSEYRDVNGRPPQHTFFFPEDEYRPEYLDELRPLIEAGFGDVDVHLHHDGDTSQQLRDKLEAFRETLYHRHGLLRKDPLTGEIVYGFIHGNWALCNSRPDGRWCGVNDELTILRETGCYADFTLPSAPSPTQTRTINSIYYARDIPGQRKSHETGRRARVGQAPPEDHLLLIQGPLLPDWGWRRWGLIPRIENGDIQGDRHATLRRLRMWLDAGVHVQGKPDWRFIKLHTHGCKDENIDPLLGPPYARFHRDLAVFRQLHPNIRIHYVTAWEMAQLVHQAEQGAERPRLTPPESATRFSPA